MSLFFIILFNSLLLAQASGYFNLKGVNNIYIQTMVCDELSNYITAFEIKSLVERLFLATDNPKIRITDDEKNAKFRLSIGLLCYPVKRDISFATIFNLYEKIYLNRIKESQWVVVAESPGIGLLPDSYEVKKYYLDNIKSSTINFIIEIKKDNQK